MGSLAPGEAARLRGKLGYGETLMFGRMGRGGRLAQFTARQYAKGARNPWLLDSDLKEALAWRISNVITSVPRWG